MSLYLTVFAQWLIPADCNSGAVFCSGWQLATPKPAGSQPAGEQRLALQEPW